MLLTEGASACISVDSTEDQTSVKIFVNYSIEQILDIIIRWGVYIYINRICTPAIYYTHTESGEEGKHPPHFCICLLLQSVNSWSRLPILVTKVRKAKEKNSFPASILLSLACYKPLALWLGLLFHHSLF